jgi:hypothetical protein
VLCVVESRVNSECYLFVESHYIREYKLDSDFMRKLKSSEAKLSIKIQAEG